SYNLDVLTPFINCEMLSIGKNNIRGNLSSLRYWTNLKRLDLAGINPQVYGLEYIAHNPFDGVSDEYGIFYQDYGPRNIDLFNNDTWRGPRSNFRKLIDKKICETINSLWQQLEKQDQELERLKQQNQELEKSKQQLEEFSKLLFPSQSYNFTQIKQEIARLKYQELAPQIRKKKEQLEQLVIDAKTKTGNLGNIVDLFLETQRQITKTNPESNEYFQTKGQLNAYQSVLETNFTKEELHNLLNKQIELVQLENLLASLQINNPQ
ncbi:31832_t:CDS:1, partial [Racocetra persica]